MRLSDIKVDSKAIEQGEWIDEIPDLPGLRLKVRGTGNADFRRQQSKLGRRDDIDRVMTQLLVDTVLIDWDGLTDDAGVPIPYSRDAAQQFLFDPDLRLLRDGVAWAANALSVRRKTDQDEDAKN